MNRNSLGDFPIIKARIKKISKKNVYKAHITKGIDRNGKRTLAIKHIYGMWGRLDITERHFAIKHQNYLLKSLAFF